ncbi:MAG TPA: hypothetical protein VGM44_11895, partial [Polyangiaceae bacterium]
RVCTGCRARAPRTESNYTLISAQHGWRLTTHLSKNGDRIAEWCCPTCWLAYRKAGGKLSERK